MTFEGIWPAMVSPFTPDDRVNEAMVRQLVEFYVGAGVDGLYVCGGTGEGLLMSPDERERVAAVAVQAAAGRIGVMVHVGAVATRDAVRLAAHATAVGADAVSAMGPLLFRSGQAGLEAHYRRIAEATDLPVFAYNIPGVMGYLVTADMFEPLLEIPNMRGMKFSDSDLYAMSRILDLDRERIVIFNGNDEILVHGLTAGAQGGIGLTYTFMPEEFVALWKLWQAGDRQAAASQQWRLNRWLNAAIAYGMGSAKAALRLRGFDCGDPRLPIMALDSSQLARLSADLHAAEFPYELRDAA